MSAGPTCGQPTDWPGQPCALVGGHPGGHLPTVEEPRPSLAEVVARAHNSSTTDPTWRTDYS